MPGVHNGVHLTAALRLQVTPGYMAEYVWADVVTAVSKYGKLGDKDMKILDYTSDVRILVLTELAAVERILPRFRILRSDPSEYLKDSARDFLALLTELYQLRRFARLGAPHIEDFGGFGTGLDDSDAPIIMSVAKGKESWDFQPWLAEKLQSAEQLIFSVIDMCAPRSDAVTRLQWRGIGLCENVGEECYRHLEGVQAYLNAILGLLESGELQIRQLSAKNSENGDDGE